MVRNNKGGNKGKKMARKHAVPMDVKTRYSEDAAEVYAVCEKLLGNGKCHVMCIDGQKRLCIIRNKFRGRGKRDNIVGIGTWILVGLREFETHIDGKLDKCDLLEVYHHVDHNNLRQKEIRFSDKWHILMLQDSSSKENQNENGEQVEDVFFQDIKEMPESETESDNEIVEENSDVYQNTNTFQAMNFSRSKNEDEIDIDDI
jgi:initiation factor 1A